MIRIKRTNNCETSPISFIFFIKCPSISKEIEMQSYCLFHLFQALKYIDTFSNKNMYHHQVYQFICQLLQKLFQAFKITWKYSMQLYLSMHTWSYTPLYPPENTFLFKNKCALDIHMVKCICMNDACVYKLDYNLH